MNPDSEKYVFLVRIKFLKKVRNGPTTSENARGSSTVPERTSFHAYDGRLVTGDLCNLHHMLHPNWQEGS